MKSNSSRLVLFAEILIIFLFHFVKIKQEEKPDRLVFTHNGKSLSLLKPDVAEKSVSKYMLVNLIK